MENAQEAETRIQELRKELVEKDRELEIQAALEKVRSRSMTMHGTDELSDVLSVLFEQFDVLGISPLYTFLSLVDLEKNLVTYRQTGKGGAKVSGEIQFPLDSMAEWEDIVRRMKDGNIHSVICTHYPIETFPKIWEVFGEIFDALPEGSKVFPEDFPNGIFTVLGYCKYGFIGYDHDREWTEEDKSIVQRFGIEFTRLYQRFLDLQKAEAQAREAQIQLSLERVRARAMAMQRSDELSELVDTVFKELTKLDFALTWCIINIIDEASMTNVVWAANPDIHKSADRYHMKFEDYPFHNAMMKGWKERKTKYVYVLDGLEKKIYDEYLFTDTEFRKVPEAAQAASRAMEKYVVSFSFSNFGGLQTVGDVPLSDASLDILSRFGKVFDLTYTRFNDLKQAEEQAREAQIQLAMERVRARTMAMQKSDELAEAANLLFLQVQSLGMPAWSAGYCIWDDEDKRSITLSMSSEGVLQPSLRMPLTEDRSLMHFREAYQRGESFFVEEVGGEELKRHYSYLRTLPGVKETLDDIEAAGFPVPAFQIFHLAYFSKGFLLFITYDPVPEAHNIFKRFAKVFEQTYTRFLDLQKVEAQAREAKIEAALEKVRSRTMAMQGSEELSDAASLLFKQIAGLGTRQWSSGFDIWNANEVSAVAWMSNPDGSIGVPFTVPYTTDPFFKQIYEARERGEDFFVMESSGKELEETYQYLFNLPEAKKHFDGIGSLGFQMPEFQITHCAFFSQGYLMFITFEAAPEMWDIFKRFAKVFEQTYTRFLDLQKAEAQAREARIEAVLERIRSRTMAMQKSDELTDVAGLLFKQVTDIGIKTWTAGFNVWSEDNNSYVDYITSPNGGFIEPYTVYTDTAEALTDISNARKSGVEFDVQYVEGEKIKQLYLALTRLDEKQYEIMLQDGIRFPSHQYEHFVFGSKVSLMFITYEPVPEAHDIFKRLGKVFEQTYTRFLDLQRAEAQAREAQIEAALERVRGKAMAMHSSEDLAATIQLFYHELVGLSSVPVIRCGVGLLSKENYIGDISFISKTSEGNLAEVKGKMDMAGHSMTKEIYENWLIQKEIHFVLRGNEIKEYYQYMRGQVAIPDYPVDATQYLYFPMFNEGSFYVVTENQLSQEDIQTYRRFVSVLSLTYKRYNDLQTAEAQAREAQIEAALERVRSRSMGMQKSDELREVIQVIYEQLIQLNFNIDFAGFAMDYRDSNDWNLWAADSTLSYPEKIHIPYLDHSQFNRFIEAKEKGFDFQVNNLTFDEKNKLWDHFLKYVPAPRPEIKNWLYKSAGLATSWVLLKDVTLYVCNTAGIPFSDSENPVLKRFGHVFEQTYTRFNDLKKAEAQALEAVKRASVDRVRAEIASMRTTKDLERITPLIWNELTTLGVPFIRCGVFIMDDEQQQVQSFLSTPDGKAIAAFRQPYAAPGEISDIVHSWHKKEIYKQHWNEARFIEFTQNLVKEGAVTSGEKYLIENRPTDLYLHFLPFLQGMLYAGNTSPLSDDELQLMQDLADAFSTAYARYEDFNKLESAKVQIEKTLFDLKQAQAQLVQSEKMASLGELTAGIAHEIQNPLNFVNNFSEVNGELINELVDEVDKGNYDEVRLIAVSLKDNEEKIIHHGKRADAIVKGMLQHTRTSAGQKEPTDINALSDEYIRLSYHGMRARDKDFNAEIKTDFDPTIGKINIVPQDMGRVLLNLYNNAFYAVSQKLAAQGSQLEADNRRYVPTVTLVTKQYDAKISISVKDNGPGIPQNIFDKIFQPFFTTKPTGEGTGLGLSLSYDIIKAHGGEIRVETREGEGTQFIIQLLTT
ncbi:MAG TPA: ATP-binding protein [Parafilimonas sp.]|nr:ATP-binding protein [Parafilimonas sp.]